MRIFTERFDDITAATIAAEIRENGIFACEGAVTDEAVDAILGETGGLDFKLNRNGISPAVYRDQTFLNQFMAVSQTAFNLVTSERITSLLRATLGAKFKMVGKRLYETRHGNYMYFHSDIESDPKDVSQVDGLGLILYLTDVEEGAFEVVEGSHRWGNKHLGSWPEDKRLIATERIKPFKMRRGSYVIYNGRLLHRAAPIVSPEVRRTSLHFQVNRGGKIGEPILVNIGWLGNLSEDAKMMLGFGEPNAVARDWPQTTPADLPAAEHGIQQYLKSSVGHFFN